MTAMISYRKENALNLIRMLAAIQVMYGHINGHLNIEMPRLASLLVGGCFTEYQSFLHHRAIS